MGWILLTFAIVLEVAGTTNMKLSEGLSNRVPSVLVIFFYALSIIALDLRRQPAGRERGLCCLVRDGYGTRGNDRALVLSGVGYERKGGGAWVHHSRSGDVAPHQRVALM